jgi:hypothetical protein
MIVFSPFMQLDSWDAFPVSSGDLELHLIGTFCVIGMFLVFVGIMNLCPSLLLGNFQAPPLVFLAFASSNENKKSAHISFASPLRI